MHLIINNQMYIYTNLLADFINKMIITIKHHLVKDAFYKEVVVYKIQNEL
jgi:hypothetical protein